jgi:long-chain-alcohol oxidase
MAALPYLAHTVVVLRDHTRGRVETGRDGRVQIHHALEKDDLERLRHGMARAAQAYLAADAVEVHLPVHGYGPVRSESDLERLAEIPLDRSRLSLVYAVHLFGGAVMGPRREDSVCAPDGACWDVRGLYVTDASGLPSNTGVNPQITVMANALRVATGMA